MSARLQAAIDAQVAAGAPGALACIEAPRAGLGWRGSAGYLAHGKSRALRPDDAFRRGERDEDRDRRSDGQVPIDGPDGKTIIHTVDVEDPDRPIRP
jgi:hypothetical protein